VGTFGAFAVIGLSLHLGQIRKYISLYLGQAAVKFMVAPLLALVMIAVFGLKSNQLAAKVVLTQGFMPTAVNSVLIANLFGLNSRLASAMFVVNTAIFLLIVLPILAVFAL
jgi:predicted permease